MCSYIKFCVKGNEYSLKSDQKNADLHKDQCLKVSTIKLLLFIKCHHTNIMEMEFIFSISGVA